MSATHTTGLQAPFTVHRVVDTRDVVEINDRFVPVAGTGDSRECDRCGRPHEIHAHVTDARGVEAIVGTGCMDVDAAEGRRFAANATREAVNAAKLADKADASAEHARLRVEVAALTFPADEVVEGPGLADDDDSYSLNVDGVRVYGRRNAHRQAERVDALERSWRGAKLIEAAGGPGPYRALQRRATRTLRISTAR